MAWANADGRLCIDAGSFSRNDNGEIFPLSCPGRWLELGKLTYQIYRRMTVVNGLFDTLLEMVFLLRKIWYYHIIKWRKKNTFLSVDRFACVLHNFIHTEGKSFPGHTKWGTPPKVPEGYYLLSQSCSHKLIKCCRKVRETSPSVATCLRHNDRCRNILSRLPVVSVRR